MTSDRKSVVVVGAGIAGLVTAKVLRDDGFEVAVFEKEPTIGGWPTDAGDTDAVIVGWGAEQC